MRKSKRLLMVFIAMITFVTGIFLVNVNTVRCDDTEETQESGKESDNAEKTITSVDDLTGSTIGVQLGTTGDIYCSDYEGDDAGTQIVRYSKAADAIQALKQGKVNCVVLDEQPSKQFVSKNSDLKILDEEFTNEDYALCISKDKSDLKDKVNAALDTLKEDGTLESIKENYTGSDDVKGSKPYNKKDVSRNNGTLVVATNVAFPPYEYYDNGNATGIDIDIMQAVCDELGMELKIEDMEFDSIITAVQSGKADVGAAGLTVTEERLKNIDFTQSYATSKQVIIVKDTNQQVIKQSFIEKIQNNFINDGKYKYILTGLGNTLIITIFAVLAGIILGFLIAIVRTYHDTNGGLNVINWICKVYLMVVRGTPVMVQLLIIYYVVFASVNINKILVAVIAFGLNSAAYIAEIVRSGIMAVDKGQFEAGRSLGLDYKTTMRKIVLPQAVKNILPALGNEFISLLKETSISGYIGLVDLTKGGDIIRSITYEAFMPLILVALVYLLIVMFLTMCVNKLERRLRSSER